MRYRIGDADSPWGCQMTRRTVFILFVLLALVAWAGPAEAGTALKDNPSGTSVVYYDVVPNPPPPQGGWQNFHVVEPKDHYFTCDTRGKWGNISNHGFVQLQATGGTACKWGGITMTTYYTDPHGVHTVVTTYNGDYCVGNPGPATITNCVQLSDGSIWLQRTTPAGSTDLILQADLITCTFATGLVPGATDKWECERDIWKIAF